MIIEKTESTIIVRCSKGQTDDFTKWLEKMAKKLNINVLYFIKKKFLTSNRIKIISTGLDEDVTKFESKIESKLLHG